MATTEFERKVRKKVLEVKRRNIVARIVKLMGHFSALQHDQSGDSRTFKGTLKLTVKGGEAVYGVESFGIHNDCYKVTVIYGGHFMLELTSGPRSVGDNYDKRRFFADKLNPLGLYTVVHCYRRGVWQEPLDLKRLIREQERECKRRAAIVEKLKALTAHREEPRDSDRDLAETLGITVPGEER